MAKAGMSSPDPESTQNSAWIPLVVTGLVIGAAFIAVYVGLQRAPVPHHLPLAVAGDQLAAAARTGLGESVSVTQVPDLEAGAARVRQGDAVAVVSASSPTAWKLEYAGASGFSESGAARQLVGGLAARAGATVEQTDIVPLIKYDSRGLTAFYVVFGVTLASFVLAQGLTGVTASVRLRHRLYALAGFAVAIGVHLLPGWARAVSAYLPPGAAYRAVNDFGYYDGSHAWSSLVVLTVWFLAGFALVLLRQAVSGPADVRPAEPGPRHPLPARFIEQ